VELCLHYPFIFMACPLVKYRENFMLLDTKVKACSLVNSFIASLTEVSFVKY